MSMKIEDILHTIIRHLYIDEDVRAQIHDGVDDMEYTFGSEAPTTPTHMTNSQEAA